jgi:hypothetical protein
MSSSTEFGATGSAGFQCIVTCFMVVGVGFVVGIVFVYVGFLLLVE